MFTKYSKMREFHQMFFIIVGERKLSVRKLALAGDVSPAGRVFNV
jgi:hypothetical protein